jgi:hypothetical protein
MVDEWKALGILTDEVGDSAGRDGAAQARNLSCGDAEATEQILIPPTRRRSLGDPPDERRYSDDSIICKRQRFQHGFFVAMTIALSMWSLPPRMMRQRIRDVRSMAFADSSPCRPYTVTPWDGTSRQTHCYLFHGTRSRHLIHFQNHGINIETFKANELATVPVFYTTNFVQAAYEHPLLAHHRVIGDVDMHVSVLVFDFDSDVLLGLKPAPGEDSSFTSRSIIPYNDDEKNQFNSVYVLTFWQSSQRSYLMFHSSVTPIVLAGFKLNLCPR